MTKIRPGPWHPLDFALWSRARKVGYRKTHVKTPRLGWDESLKAHAMPRGGLPVLILLGFLLALAVTAAGGWAAVAVGAVLASSMLALANGAEIKKRYVVVYQTAPCWRVGEHQRDRDLSDPDRTDMPDADHYPDDYAGMVLGVKPFPATWGTPALLSPNRQTVGLDLNLAQVLELSTRQKRIDPVTYTVATVTLDHRYGATLPGLIAKFGSTADVRTAELEADAQDLAGQVSAEPHVFRAEFDKLKRALPKNIVHSGAGLYEVGPAKTYATFTLALAQLWTDQGAAAFTANQYIRAFADTYVETVTPNSSLNPDETGDGTLIIEGDPGDDRANIIIASGGARDVLWSCDHGILRHLTAAQPASSVAVQGGSGCQHLRVDDCAIITDYPLLAANRLTVEDATLTSTGTIRRAIYTTGLGSVFVRRSILTGTGKATATIGAILSENAVVIESCIINGWKHGVEGHAPGDTSLVDIRNCDFYSCTNGIYLPNPLDAPLVVTNNIFKDCDNNYLVASTGWPEEAAAVLGADVVQRNNCFHGYTNFAYDGSTVKTFAQWNAYNRVDASGDLDATDPLLTNPGAGDFSLQSGSPCRNTGHGSGVLTGYNAVVFDANQPDIGAWSSGTALADAPVIIGANADDPDNGDAAYGVGDTITLSFDIDTNESTPPPVEGTITGTRMDGLYTLSNSHTFGGESDLFTVAWDDAKTLVISVAAVSTADVALGDTVTLQTAADIKNLAETSAASTATSVGLTGDWGVYTPPAPGLSVAVSGTTITATLTGSHGRYRARLEEADGTEVEEKSRVGAGDVAFTGATPDSHYNVLAWPVSPTDDAIGEPSPVIDAYVEPSGAVSPTGLYSSPLDNFRTLLANSGNFQTLVGAGSPAVAKGYIHVAAEPAATFTRPCAIVWIAPGYRGRAHATGAQHDYAPNGVISCRFEFPISSAYKADANVSDAYYEFTNRVGAIVGDMEAVAKTYLNCQSFTAVAEPERSPKEPDEGQSEFYYRQVWTIEWGI